MNPVIKNLHTLLIQDQSVVLATIISHEGSTPRTAGTRMIILPQGQIIGTIGGGPIEAEVIQTATGIYKSKTACMQTYDLRGPKSANILDVICGGRLTVLIDYIEPSQEHKAIFKELNAIISQGHSALLISNLQQKGDHLIIDSRCLFKEDMSPVGRFCRNQAVLESLVAWTGKERAPVLVRQDDLDFLVEPFLKAETVFIFGAGHVARQLAALCKMVAFRTIVLDDREEFANRERFQNADQIIVLDDFKNAFNELQIDRHSYIVIVTRGHSHDRTILARALKTDAVYIGMIGSRKKRDIIYGKLLQEGFTQMDIDRVMSPIGIDIAAETPEEIAVSIVGELIQHRASNALGNK